MTYRPWLDGIRAFSVLLVLVGHAWQPRFNMGGVGVGIFFSLSGFLITSILLNELSKSGRISLTEFYIRRAARLMPALILAIVVSNVIFVFVRDGSAIKDSPFALLYVANYAMIARGEYLSGYGHTWSLAVEEHFYLIWPVTIAFLAPRLGLRRTLIVTLGLCALALAWRFVITHAFEWHRFWTYMGTLERADALLYGCAAAMAVRLGWKPTAWMPWVATLVIGVLIFLPELIPGTTTVRRAVLAIAGAVLVCSLDFNESPLRRVLSHPWLISIGTVSYGIYLWHIPLMEAGYKFKALNTMEGRFLLGALSIAVAYASFHFFEHPIRERVREWRAQSTARGDADGQPVPVKLPVNK